MIAAREEQPQAPVVQPEVVSPPPEVTQGVTQTPFGPGRNVLPDITPEGIKARDAAAADDLRQQADQKKQDQLKAQAAAKAEAKEAGVKTRQHTAKTAQAKEVADNRAAERITAQHAHPQGAPYADDRAVEARARKMVAAAKAEGVKVPEAFAPGHRSSPAMLKLREAMDLVSPRKDANGNVTPRLERIARFIDREHMIDNGREEEAFAARRDEGKLGLGSPEGAADRIGARADADEVAEQTGEHIVPTEAEEGHTIAEGVTAHEEAPAELPTEYAGGGGEEHAPPTAASEPPEPLRPKIEVERGRALHSGQGGYWF